jgi:hypothetical protein
MRNWRMILRLGHQRLSPQSYELVVSRFVYILAIEQSISNAFLETSLTAFFSITIVVFSLPSILSVIATQIIESPSTPLLSDSLKRYPHLRGPCPRLPKQISASCAAYFRDLILTSPDCEAQQRKLLNIGIAPRVDCRSLLYPSYSRSNPLRRVQLLPFDLC